MFKRILASIGIGNAQIDTVLHTEYLLPGMPFTGEIRLMGGDVTQSLSGIDLVMMTRMSVETPDGEHTQDCVLASWHLQDDIELQANENRTLDFQGEIPFETPITVLPLSHPQSQVWLTTNLNIDNGVDAKDVDTLQIHPTPIMESVINAMNLCGFKLKKADVEKGYLNGGNFQSSTGCYQELEFAPEGWGFSSVQEVEISFVPEANVTHLLVELDRRFSGDTYKSLSITHTTDDIEQIEQRLQQLLQ